MVWLYGIRGFPCVWLCTAVGFCGGLVRIVMRRMMMMLRWSTEKLDLSQLMRWWWLKYSWRNGKESKAIKSSWSLAVFSRPKMKNIICIEGGRWGWRRLEHVLYDELLLTLRNDNRVCMHTTHAHNLRSAFCMHTWVVFFYNNDDKKQKGIVCEAMVGAWTGRLTLVASSPWLLYSGFDHSSEWMQPTNTHQGSGSPKLNALSADVSD